jgi:lipid II:glycine glycyltransferase (peptidoglycan interpeptide bridge formation enzyme)
VTTAPVEMARASVTDAPRWDAFVEGSDPGSYLQLSPWARVKAVNGWRSARIADESGPVVGAQVLVRRPAPLPWGFAYAPRGPVANAWDADAIVRFTETARRRLRRRVGRVSHLRIDPEVERDGPHDANGALRDALRRAGWRTGSPIQPEATRIIDLTADEAALWSDLRKKWRQYVNRARTLGYRVVDADGDRLPEFYEIYRETAQRAGFLIRTEQAYRDVWEAYRPHGRARLLFAQDSEGAPQAALFLVRAGPRVVEPYGGMTAEGAESRANYLLKWEAIRTSREQGATSYDLWGLASAGIAHFKTGFGGREVRYVGAWDLVLDRVGRTTFDLAQRGRVWVARRRHGLAGRARSPVAADAADAE